MDNISSSGVPETAVVFMTQGGHDHNGINSTLIDFSLYNQEQLNNIKEQLGVPSEPDPTDIPAFPNGVIISGQYIGDTSLIPGPGGSTAPNTPSGLRLVTGSTFINYEQVYIDVFWGAPDQSDPAIPRITSYEVELVEDGVGQVHAPARIQEPTTQYRFIPLKPNTRYGIRVRAIDSLGQSSVFLPSVGYEYITTAVDQTIPVTVTGVGMGCGVRTATIFWDENPDVDVMSGRGSYHIQFGTDNTFATVLEDKTISGTVTSFTDLISDTQYYARVSAIDSSGNEGPWSSTVTATTAFITDNDIQAGTINADRIVAASITATQIQAGTITADKLASNSIIADNIATGTLDAATITIGPTGVLRAGSTSGDRYSTEYQSLILGDSRLVVYYKLTDNFTTTIVDSKSGINGTISGTYTLDSTGALANDSTNKAIKFGDGGTNYGKVVVTDTAALRLASYTVEGWVEVTHTASWYQQIACKGTDGSNADRNYGIFVAPSHSGDPSGTCRFHASHSDGSSFYAMDSNNTYNVNAYHHVVAVFDTFYLKLFVNGQLDNVMIAPTPTHGASGNLVIGNSNNGTTYPQKGNFVDEVAIYSSAISDNDVLQHYLAATNSYQYTIFDANGIRFYNRGTSAFSGGNLVMELDIATGSGAFYGALSSNSMYSGKIFGGIISGAEINGQIINGGTINSTVLNSITINAGTINSVTINAVDIYTSTLHAVDIYSSNIYDSYFELSGGYPGEVIIKIDAAFTYSGYAFNTGGQIEMWGDSTYMAEPMLLKAGANPTYAFSSILGPMAPSGGARASVQFLAWNPSSTFDGSNIILEADVTSISTTTTSSALIAAADQCDFGNGFGQNTYIWDYCTSLAFNIYSDSSIKKGIKNISGKSLDKIKQLRPVTYELKTDPKSNNRTGFIAEEVQQLLPDVIKSASILDRANPRAKREESVLTVDLGGLITHLTKAIQELSAEVDILKNKK